MPELIVFPQWRSDYQNTKFPFADTASLTNSEGLFFVEGLLLDMQLYPVGGQPRAYVSEVIITNQTCKLIVGDTGDAARCSCTFDLLPATVSLDDDETDLVLRFFDAVGRPAGIAVSTALRLSMFQSWSVGSHTFQITESPLVASVWSPTPELGVRGFLLDDDSIATGDVWLVGEDGVVLRLDEDTVAEDQCGKPMRLPVVRVDVVGDPLFRRRLCTQPGFFQTPRFIQTITIKVGCDRIRLTPDSAGDFKIVVGSNLASDTVLRISPSESGLLIDAIGEPVAGVTRQ